MQVRQLQKELAAALVAYYDRGGSADAGELLALAVEEALTPTPRGVFDDEEESRE
jgi:hypothetical protein